MVLGGKTGNTTSDCKFSKSVIFYEMNDFFTGDISKSVQWKTSESMNCERANFAAIVLDNLVYVYGGIQGSQNH
jgi:hypothetical protein